MTKVSWETKKFIWISWMKGQKDADIGKDLELNADKYPDAPTHRDTIRRVRDELLKMNSGKIRTLIDEEPNIKEFIVERRPELAGELDHSEDMPRQLNGSTASSDDEILGLMARVFDRPAFTLVFGTDRPAPDFRKAVADTIQALNTGLWRTRDGSPIKTIPSRHDLNDPSKRKALGEIELKLKSLTSRYDHFVKTGDVRSEKWDRKYSRQHASPMAAKEMDDIRIQIVADFRRVYPSFDVWMQPPLPSDEE